MIRKQILVMAVLAALLFSIAAGNQVHAQNEQHTQTSLPLLAMPVEYLNYTLSVVNGTLWAKIDGLYPITLAPEWGTDTLPMLYPTPPNTTNIHVMLDDSELSWSDYSEIDPTARHHTDIGDWQMIYCVAEDVSGDFVLKIHYEHPVEVINGTYTFLYDLNISPYLSEATPNSTAHFRIQLETNCSSVNVYATGFNGTWTPMNYTSSRESNGEILTFDVFSEYNKLVGDIAVILTDAQIPELPAWTIMPLLAATALAAASVFRKKHTKKA